MKRERPTFTLEFKKQIVQLWQNGKTPVELLGLE